VVAAPTQSGDMAAMCPGAVGVAPSVHGGSRNRGLDAVG
jgi:hypothetical protein